MKHPLLLIAGQMTTLAVVAFGQNPYATDDGTARASVINTCGRCHGLDYYVTPRSRKSWELTVYRMRDYDYDEAGGLTTAEAESAIDYLATYFHEDSTLDAAEHFGADWKPSPSQTVAMVASATTDAAPSTPSAGNDEATLTHQEVKPADAPVSDTTTETALLMPLGKLKPAVTKAVLPPPRPGVSARVREKLENPPWRPGVSLLRCAKCTAYSAVLCLVGLLLTGHSRRRLRKHFRSVHAVLALGLFLSLACHGMVYLARYGTPPVLWYWFGAGSFLVLVLAQLQGILRKQFGKLFLRIHVYAGYSGLLLAVLHWVWAWR